MSRERSCVRSSVNSFCSFFSGIGSKTKKNYNQTAQIIDMPAKYIAKGIGSAVCSLGLGSVGALVDKYWQPLPSFPPLCATVGATVGAVSGLAEPLTKVALIPVNGVFSVINAVGEQVVDSMSAKWNDFYITYNYVNDMFFFRYVQADGHTKEMQPNPSLILGPLVAGVVATTRAGVESVFTSIASLAVPFGSFVGLPAVKLAVPLAAAAGVAVAKPATKMVSFTAGLFAIPIAPLYRCLKSKENAQQQPDLGDMLQQGSYQRLSISSSGS